MKHCTVHFSKIKISFYALAICTGLGVINIKSVDAAVVAREQPTPAASPSRANTSTSRMPTLSTSLTTSTSGNNDSGTVNTDSEPVAETQSVANEIIEDKTSQFDTVVGKAATSENTESENTELAEMVRRQRASLDSQSIISGDNENKHKTVTSSSNSCDSALRNCMQQKCGTDYSKCKGDTDTIWGDKMDLCRRDTNCTGHEYALFTVEIKADRDMNARLSAYQKVLDCGNSYNECIEKECGATFNKCLGKKAGDLAISKCERIAKDCTQQDSGLASRVMNVFGILRQDAEKQIQRDEKRLYELRDSMASQCRSLGAMLDERSMDCVYTVNFFAGDSATPMASKKLYAGGAFNCDQNWFGIDATTFKENAYRATRAQTSATSAFMGAGVGSAVGMVTSGMLDRAIDRQKAEKALKEAEKQKESESDSTEKTQKKPEKKSGEKSDGDGANPPAGANPKGEGTSDTDDPIVPPTKEASNLSISVVTDCTGQPDGTVCTASDKPGKCASGQCNLKTVSAGSDPIVGIMIERADNASNVVFPTKAYAITAKNFGKDNVTYSKTELTNFITSGTTSESKLHDFLTQSRKNCILIALSTDEAKRSAATKYISQLCLKDGSGFKFTKQSDDYEAILSDKDDYIVVGMYALRKSKYDKDQNISNPLFTNNKMTIGDTEINAKTLNDFGIGLFSTKSGATSYKHYVIPFVSWLKSDRDTGFVENSGLTVETLQNNLQIVNTTGDKLKS